MLGKFSNISVFPAQCFTYRVAFCNLTSVFIWKYFIHFYSAVFNYFCSLIYRCPVWCAMVVTVTVHHPGLGTWWMRWSERAKEMDLLHLFTQIPKLNRFLKRSLPKRLVYNTTRTICYHTRKQVFATKIFKYLAGVLDSIAKKFSWQNHFYGYRQKLL